MEKEFEESFEHIYKKVVTLCEPMVKQAKNEMNSALKKFLIVGILINIVGITLFNSLDFIFITIIAFFIMLIKENNKYIKVYKSNVIQTLIKGYNEKYYFEPNEGITKNDYIMSNFDNSFDKYKSEDKIYGEFESGDNFQIAEIVTSITREKEDINGNRSTSTIETFRGIYGIARLQKNFISSIHIVSNSKKRKFSKNRVEVDSALFEEYFDCLTSDKVMAMRVFTSELLEKYLEIVKNNKKSFEFKIENNMIYFRYKTNNLFEPMSNGWGIEKEILKKYYKTIYYPIEILKSTIENVNKIVE